MQPDVHIRDDIACIEDEMIATRRHFHTYPELLFDCHESAKLIATRLRSYGYEVTEGVAISGVVAVIRAPLGADEPRRCIALRADMDALPIQELSDAPYCSQRPGVSHMCGHDAHMAILLGAAKVIACMQNRLKGDVKLIFQPAEEGGAGGRHMVEAGVLENPHVNEIYALHVWNLMAPGTVGVAAGAVMVNSDRFSIDIKGRGGHGGQPEATVDAVVVAAAVVSALQSIVSRNCSPFETAVVTVGMLKAGTAPNVIAESAHMEGTARSESGSVRCILEKRITEVAQAVAHTYGAEAQVIYTRCYPAVVNTALHTERLRAAALKIVPQGIREPVRFAGGEDFSFMLERLAEQQQDHGGCFFFLGSHPVDSMQGDAETIANELARKTPRPHHCPRFDIAEKPTLAIGASIFVQLVEDNMT